MSLHDLIDLAKQTGDRLIVHDPIEGRDVVVMDIESYKHLVLGRRPVHKLSEKQMLDQINRDISVWRANEEQEELFAKSMALEKEMAEHPLPDPFEEDDLHAPDWHSAGSVIGREYKNNFSFAHVDEEDDDEDEEITILTPLMDETQEITELANLPTSGLANSPFELNDIVEEDEEGDEYKVPNIDWHGNIMEEKRSIPPSLAGEGNAWHEEPLLPEEPVFFEEPV